MGLNRGRVRTLRPGEPWPDGEPRRYKNAKGYTRLRWKVGKGQYVETYERDATGALVRDRPPEAKRIDFEKAGGLYAAGRSLNQIASELGCTNGQLSRGLRARGITMRSSRDYAEGVNADEVVRLYREGYSCHDAARLAGTSNGVAFDILRSAGLMRRPGRPKGTRRAAYQAEFRRQRPAVVERAGDRCEAAVLGVCTGRIEHIHHRLLRRHGGTNDLANLLAVCRACHLHIHHHPAWSYEAGFLIRRSVGEREARESA